VAVLPLTDNPEEAENPFTIGLRRISTVVGKVEEIDCSLVPVAIGRALEPVFGLDIGFQTCLDPIFTHCNCTGPAFTISWILAHTDPDLATVAWLDSVGNTTITSPSRRQVVLRFMNEW
jgi:hypothetical protein